MSWRADVQLCTTFIYRVLLLVTTSQDTRFYQVIHAGHHTGRHVAVFHIFVEGHIVAANSFTAPHKSQHLCLMLLIGTSAAQLSCLPGVQSRCIVALMCRRLSDHLRFRL